ncbi:MAG: hypothetical protein Q4F30_06345 [Akkermansia sp.]|nr:hypothetical protein [Akkermansia sp.]
MSKSTKSPKPPAKVRAGEVLSARWLNKVVDCLGAAQAASAATAAAAASSSSINTRPLLRNNKYREPEPRPLPVFGTEDFRLRVKPRQFCEADAEGNWAKVLQVHEGHIIDYRGLDLLVPFTKDSGSGSGSGSAREEAPPAQEEDDETPRDEVLECGKDWHDMGFISASPLSVYCIIRQDCKGEVTEAVFSTAPVAYKPWGFRTSGEAEAYLEAQAKGEPVDIDGSGVVSVLIGTAHSEVVGEDGDRHYYIDQQHSGRIELQVVEVQPFTPVLAADSGSADALPEALCPFWRREGNLFVFKGLFARPGITLTDGPDIGIGLETANDGQADNDTDQPGDSRLGGVQDIRYNDVNVQPHIRSGTIDIPTADTRQRHATGVIGGVTVEYSETGGSYIEDGIIHVVLRTDGGSVPGSGSGSVPGPTPGPGSGSGSPDPDNPTPTPTPGCNCNCVEYTFDPAYFIVQDHNVSLNAQAISDLVDEVLGEISVDVNVEGLVEHTEYGELKASGQGSAPGGVDSRISY